MSKSPEIQATLEDVLTAAPFLARVLKLKLDPQLRYHVLKLDGYVESDAKHFTRERNALIEEYGVTRPTTGAERARLGQDEITDVAMASPENRKAFAERVAALVAVEVVIPWGPITRAMVEKYEDITAEDCKGLGPLFELDPPMDAKE